MAPTTPRFKVQTLDGSDGRCPGIYILDTLLERPVSGPFNSPRSAHIMHDMMYPFATRPRRWTCYIQNPHLDGQAAKILTRIIDPDKEITVRLSFVDGSLVDVPLGQLDIVPHCRPDALLGNA